MKGSEGRADVDALLRAALRGEGVAVACQPVVDAVGGGIVGYESLARFSGLAGSTPDQWFAAALVRDMSADLDAVVITKALELRSTIPRNCFLALNLEPGSLGHPEVDRALRSSGRLDGVVLEITEHMRIECYDTFLEQLAPYRNLGALVAIDDAGAGYSGLQQILRLRPEILKLDRALIVDVDQDEAKAALVEMLGVFANRIDAWILAEGIERVEEAATLLSLGVPLAQGYFYARPGAPWCGLTEQAIDFFTAHGPAGGEVVTLAPLLTSAPHLPEDELSSVGALLAGGTGCDHVVVVDRDGRPVGIVDRDSALIGTVLRPLKINVHSSIIEVAQRMITRPTGERLRLAVCHDDLGRYVGTLPAERVMRALTALAGSAAPAAHAHADLL